MYHVLNRAVRRATLFSNNGDFAAFERVLQEARDRVPMRLLAFCVMPNHTSNGTGFERTCAIAPQPGAGEAFGSGVGSRRL